MTHSIARWAAAGAAVIILTGAVRTEAQVLADSRAQFSGTQGQDGWRHGYRSYTIEGSGEDNYDPAFSFIEFAGGAGFGDWDGFNQIWNEAGQAWDANTEPAGPWTVIGEEVVHPNGGNSFPYDEQWVIRRWVAEGVGPNTFVQITWNTRKQNTGGGDGVTGGIWINGEKISAAAIAGNDGVGVTRTNYARISNADAVDLVLTPVGPNGDRSDGFDGSYHWMILEIPADTDGDGLPDAWELLYAGDLTSLTGTGDFDPDGVSDADELPRGTNPTLADTDGDGLPDGVETNTGTFVSATNTGADPLNPDTDGDGRLDGDEVNGDIKTDVFNPDSDGDSFSDGIEVAAGHDPNDFGDTLVSSLIANSAEEFSGVQGLLPQKF